MKQLPEVILSFEALEQLVSLAPLKAPVLAAGIELKVFNYLTEPASAAMVAQAITAYANNVQILLDGLAALDLVTKKNGLYQNTPLAEAFLAEQSPTYLGVMLAQYARMERPTSDDLVYLIKEGPPEIETTLDEQTGAQQAGVMEELDEQEIAQRLKLTASAYADVQRSGIAQQLAELVAALPEFPTFATMLDLGGGAGLIGVAIVTKHPTMMGVIFDLPPVVEAAKNYIAEYGMQQRIKVLGGDYTCDPLGGPYDLILASASLHAGRQNLDMLLAKIYHALNSGGVFVSVHEGLTHEQTKPLAMVLPRIPFALQGMNLSFEQGEIAHAMVRAGFRSIHSRTITMPYSPLDLDIARK
ncbi:MAG: acetylserotonin O-methyltransferase [Chloroflexales bacterium]|nr:acetylserotonin O-methyltransferase [Chloroflexales bacterium]